MNEQQDIRDVAEHARTQGVRGISRWLAEGARSALLLAPRWEGLAATPWTMALLMLAGIVLNLGLERLSLQGPASFEWRALAGGWVPTLVAAWVCYWVRPSGAEGKPAIGAAHLFCMMLAQALFVSLAAGGLYAGLARAHLADERVLGESGVWALWLLPAAWTLQAQLVLLRRSGTRRPARLSLAAAALFAGSALQYAVQPVNFWLPDGEEAQEQRDELLLTQELMEAQPQLLAQRLNDIRQQRPGVVDVYALTFAPYADEDVFVRESRMVADVMARRFDAQGRALQFVNHASTVQEWPWATPRNLQRAIRRVAAAMDREEDVLFLHLTSHGARNGQLAADFWPMAVAPVRPEELRAWLDEAGIKYRVISISACYSGSWIEPLKGANTLVMTAADADHTSYGCGRGSELTFFGRAMYDEQLRKHTLSFEAAHAAARTVILRREEEAGKDDGYSNPQIHVGAGIRPRLALLEQQLKTRGKNAGAKESEQR